MTTYRAVLREQEMPAVFVAHAVSLVGSVAAELALAVLVFQRTASPLLSALTLACAFMPQAFSAIVLSGMVDRVPARRLLVGCDLACALLVAGMTVPGTPVAVLLLLALLTGVVTPLFGGARSAMLADVLEGELWVRARSMMRVLSQSALLLGFAVGGLLLTSSGRGRC
jgi:MFS family permease